MTDRGIPIGLFSAIAAAIPQPYSEWRLEELESLSEHLARFRSSRRPLEDVLRYVAPQLSTPARSRMLADLVNHARRLRAEKGLLLSASAVNSISEAADAAFQQRHGLERLAVMDVESSLGRLSLRQAVVTALAIDKCLQGARAPFLSAAEDLGISKANVSKILDHAETNLGVVLFERYGTGKRRSGNVTLEGSRIFGPLCGIADGAIGLTFALTPPALFSLVPAED